jgi:hypothetical protein
MWFFSLCSEPIEEKINISSTKLKTIPNSLRVRVLDCTKNDLTYLPDLLETTELLCSHNKIKTLPKLPKIKRLICDNNDLRSIPMLNYVTAISCRKNKLKILPKLPNISLLICDNNKIRSMPKNIFQLYMYNNRIKHIVDDPNQRISGNKVKDYSRSIGNTTKYNLFLKTLRNRIDLNYKPRVQLLRYRT